MAAPVNPEPKISVHVSLPRVVEAGRLNLHRDNWRWIHCLDIPVNVLDNHSFALKPYKWIRYATGMVVGAHGSLSFNQNHLEEPDHNANHIIHPDLSRDLYYHCNDEEKRRLFPTDPKMAATKITSSVATSRREGLRQELIERDGGRCVLSNKGEAFCAGVHLIAHSKGDSVSTFFSTYHCS